MCKPKYIISDFFTSKQQMLNWVDTKDQEGYDLTDISCVVKNETDYEDDEVCTIFLFYATMKFNSAR